MQPKPSEPHPRTQIATILFVDIVGFSKKTVAEQLTVKQAFSRLLLDSVGAIPRSSYVMRDTGDGALVVFTSDPEHALLVAMALASGSRRGLYLRLGENDLRIGINLGSVKQSLDVETRPNFIGEGINTASRIVDFAAPGEIAASRAYFEAVVHLESEYEGLFAAKLSRADKHGRVHELFAVKSDERLLERLRLNLETTVVLSGRSPGGAAVVGEAIESAFEASAPSKIAHKLTNHRHRLLAIGALILAVGIGSYATLSGVRQTRPPTMQNPKPPDTVSSTPAAPVAPVAGSSSNGPTIPDRPSASKEAPVTAAAPPATNPASSAVSDRPASETLPPDRDEKPQARDPRVPQKPPSVQSSLRTATSVAPVPKKPSSERCERILEKASLGEPLSKKENQELAQSCR